MGGSRKAVFLDRDGVLNRPLIRDGRPYPPDSCQTMEILPDVLASCEVLKRLGFLLICVTNQPDIARGTADINEVTKINEMLKVKLSLTDVMTCIHDDSDNCGCRKPRPGLILEAAKKYTIDLSRSYMVGDRWRDIEAGYNAGCKTVFIDWNYQEKRPAAPDLIVKNLAESISWIQNTSTRW